MNRGKKDEPEEKIELGEKDEPVREGLTAERRMNRKRRMNQGEKDEPGREK